MVLQPSVDRFQAVVGSFAAAEKVYFNHRNQLCTAENPLGERKLL